VLGEEPRKGINLVGGGQPLYWGKGGVLLSSKGTHGDMEEGEKEEKTLHLKGESRARRFYLRSAGGWEPPLTLRGMSPKELLLSRGRPAYH